MDRDAKFFSELKQLNEDFVNLIVETHKKSPYFDFSPTLNDYIKQFDDLNKQFNNSDKQFSNSNKSSIDLNKPFIDPNKPFIDPNKPFIDPSKPFIDPNKPFIDPNKPFGETKKLDSVSQPVPAPKTVPAPVPDPAPTPASFFSFTAKEDVKPPSLFSSFMVQPQQPPQLQLPQQQQQQPNSTLNNTQEEYNDNDDSPPPQPNVDKFEETDFKYQIRCKLYERAPGLTQINLLGFGMLYVKQLDSPNKLQVIVRQEPDLRKVLLNEMVTQHIPLKMLPKAVQLIVPDPSGQSKFYIAKVKDEKDASELYELLSSTKN